MTMKKMKMLVTYKGHDGGFANHVNHVFESDDGQQYGWYTNSEKLDHIQYDQKLSLSATFDDSFDDVIYIKNVRIKEDIK